MTALMTRFAIVATLSAIAAVPVGRAQDVGKWAWHVGVHDVVPKSSNNDIVNVDSAQMLTFSGRIRPYVGVGLNYTMLFDEGTTGALAGAKLKLDDSFGPAGRSRSIRTRSASAGVSEQRALLRSVATCRTHPHE